MALCLFACIGMVACFIGGFVAMARQASVLGLQRDLAAATEKLNRSPPGIERAEAFVEALKRIDPGYAPADVKQAWAEYIAALDRGLVRLRAGTDSELSGVEIARAMNKLHERVQIYD